MIVRAGQSFTSFFKVLFFPGLVYRKENQVVFLSVVG